MGPGLEHLPETRFEVIEVLDLLHASSYLWGAASFEHHAHRMAYDEYLAAGYPIASGVVEGPAAVWSTTAWSARVPPNRRGRRVAPAGCAQLSGSDPGSDPCR